MSWLYVWAVRAGTTGVHTSMPTVEQAEADGYEVIGGDPRYPDTKLMTTLPGLPGSKVFWGQVSIGKLGECWEWQGANSRGYGYLWFGRRMWKAHRLVFYLCSGTHPQVVRHTCDNPPCC